PATARRRRACATPARVAHRRGSRPRSRSTFLTTRAHTRRWADENQIVNPLSVLRTRRRDGLHVELDAHFLSDEHAAGLERKVPGEAPVLAVDFGGRAERDPLIAHRRGAGALELDLERDRTGDLAHGEVAGQRPGAGRTFLDTGGPERDVRVAVDVEEVGTAEVRVAVDVARLERRDLDVDLGMGAFGLVRDGDASRHVGKAAAHLRDHEVSADELD